MNTVELPNGQEPNQETESMSDRTKRIFSGLTPEEKLIGTEEYNGAYFSMTPEEQEGFHSWQAEEAAKLNPNLWQIIKTCPKDDAGNFVVPSDKTEKFVKALTRFGFKENGPTDEEIKEGIDKAKKIVTDGHSVTVLEATPFLGERDFKRLIDGKEGTRVRFDREMFVPAEIIRGTMGHDSWAGRGVGGMDDASSVIEGYSVMRSIHKIENFATRDTQIRSLDFLALDLILTEDGPIVFTENAHRVSAAKLRGEPLRFSSITIYE